MNRNDVKVLRDLGRKLAEAAAMQVNAQTIDLWKRLNALKPVRPMIMLDQLPWNELNATGELTLQCQDEYLRGIENELRQRLYKFNHCRGDMVAPDYVEVRKAVRVETGFHTEETILVSDPTNSVVSHKFQDQIPDDAALDRIPMPVVSVDNELDRKHLEMVGEVFDGILKPRLVGPLWGGSLHGGVWDTITFLRGVEPVLYDLIERPDFTHRVITKFVTMCGRLVDQYEQLGLFDAGNPLVHCTGAYTDELPAKGYDGKKARAKDEWVFAMAQVFSSVSPEMHEEFEIEPIRPLVERFGLTYYGCCDPLDRKIHIVRKIGMSGRYPSVRGRTPNGPPRKSAATTCSRPSRIRPLSPPTSLTRN